MTSDVGQGTIGNAQTTTILVRVTESIATIANKVENHGESLQAQVDRLQGSQPPQTGTEKPDRPAPPREIGLLDEQIARLLDAVDRAEDIATVLANL